jgi:hypothetical protein
MKSKGDIKAGQATAKVVLGVTISLDGYAEDGKGSVEPLYSHLDILRKSELLQKSIRKTGSVVMDWKEYAMAKQSDWADYEYQTPIFVITDEVPRERPPETWKLKFIF